MIKKISRKEIEDLIKNFFGIKEIKYFKNNGCEGYGEDFCVDFEFVEGEDSK